MNLLLSPLLQQPENHPVPAAAHDLDIGIQCRYFLVTGVNADLGHYAPRKKMRPGQIALSGREGRAREECPAEEREVAVMSGGTAFLCLTGRSPEYLGAQSVSVDFDQAFPLDRVFRGNPAATVFDVRDRGIADAKDSRKLALS